MRERKDFRTKESNLKGVGDIRYLIDELSRIGKNKQVRSTLVVSRRQTTIQGNFMCVVRFTLYVVYFMSPPGTCVRKLLCNLRTLKI
jgi:hypothetical protein